MHIDRHRADHTAPSGAALRAEKTLGFGIFFHTIVIDAQKRRRRHVAPSLQRR